MSQHEKNNSALQNDNESGSSGSWLSSILDQVLLQHTSVAHQERFKLVAQAIEQEVEVMNYTHLDADTSFVRWRCKRTDLKY
jgi:hypothetical protein